MSRPPLRSLLPLAFCLLLLVPGVAGGAEPRPADLEGCWILTLKLGVPFGRKQARLCLENAGEVTKGRLLARDEWHPVQPVRVVDGAYRIVAELPKGEAIFLGRRVGSQLTGTVSGPFPLGGKDFDAVREE